MGSKIGLQIFLSPKWAQKFARRRWVITTPILRRFSRFKDQYYSIHLVWNTYAAWVYDIPTISRDISGVKSVASASMGGKTRRSQKITQLTPHKNTSTMMHHMALSAINRQWQRHPHPIKPKFSKSVFEVSSG